MLATHIPTKNEKLQPTKTDYNPELSLPNIRFLESENPNEKISETIASKSWELAKKEIRIKETPRTLVQLADANMLKGNYTRALEQYKKAINLEPTTLYAYPKIIACILIQTNPVTQKDILEADRYHQQLLKLTDYRTEFFHNYILFKLFFYRDKKNIAEETLENISEIIKKEPNNFEAINTKGFIFLSFKNDSNQAKDFFELALKINPTYYHSLNNLGICFANFGDWERAESLYNQAIKINPLYNSPYENLASLYISNKKLGKAITILEDALKRNVSISFNWKHKVGLLYFDLGEYELALNNFQSILNENPNSYSLLNDIGASLSRLGKNEIALDYFNKAITVFNHDQNQRNSLEAFYNIGKVGLMTGNQRLLQQASDQILLVNKNDLYARYLAGAAALRRNEFKKAKELYLEVLKLNPNMMEIYPDLSFLMMCIEKDYKSAISLLLPLGENVKDRDLIDNNLAYALIKSGQLDKAEQILSKDLNRNPALFATNGLYWFRKDNLEKGNNYYKKALETLKDSDKENLAQQIWNFEKAFYWFRKNDKKKALENIKEAKKIGLTYMASEIKEMEEKINTLK